jgi:3-oxoacyl-[acyl-carrier-protein] synthase-1
MQKNRKVYIEGIDACCSAGLNREELFNSIIDGKTGIRRYKDFLIDNTLSAIGKIESKKSFDDLMIETIERVLDKSILDNFHNTFLAVGSSVGGMAWAESRFIKSKGSYRDIILEKQSIYSISYTLNKRFNFKDSITFSTACTSSSNAILFAKELIEVGAYDNILVVGADSLSFTTVNGFNALGVLSKKPSIPFDRFRDGMNVAEGIGVMLLGSKKSGIRLAGVGCSSDAYNITHPKPNGEGAGVAMRNALRDANIDSSRVEYINTHGTGTTANDSAEAKAIIELFPHRPLVSSTKSITGHTLGACGAIEGVISAMILDRGQIPANLNLQNQEFKELNLTKESISKNIEFILSNAFAFGGNNVSIILQRVENED